MTDPESRDPTRGEPGGSRTWAVVLALAFGALGAGLFLLLWGARDVRPGTAGSQLYVLIGTSLLTSSLTALLIAFVVDRGLEAHLRRVARDPLRAVLNTFLERTADVVPLFHATRWLGVDNVYIDRDHAMVDIDAHLRAELAEAAAARRRAPRGRPRLWVIASSAKGVRKRVIVQEVRNGVPRVRTFEGEIIIGQAGALAAEGRLDLRILLVHPAYADFRASQEGRGSGDIPSEIDETLEFLRRCDVPSQAIRFVRAAPTVFAIATRSRMLLNPYPYTEEGSLSFTILVSRAHAGRNPNPALHRDVFEQYEERHFQLPWHDGLPLLDGYGIPRPE